MLVTNELKHRKRAVGLMFFDFLEALARLADFISPPSMEKLLDETMIKAKSSDSDGSNVHPLEYHRASRSGGWIASSSESDHLPTRPDKRISNQPHVNLTQPPESGGAVDASGPLHEKFSTLLDYLLHHHRSAFGGKDLAECATKMMIAAVDLGGGVELG